MSLYKERLSCRPSEARNRARARWRRWAKHQAIKRLRQAARRSPEDAPTKPSYWGYED